MQQTLKSHAATDGLQIEYEIFSRQPEQRASRDRYFCQHGGFHSLVLPRQEISCEECESYEETPDAPTPLFYRRFPEDNLELRITSIRGRSGRASGGRKGECV